MTRIAIIGGGNIGEALASGLVADTSGPAAGISAQDVIVVDPTAARLDHLHERYGVATTDDAVEAATEADIVVVAVKPYVVASVLDQISATLDANDTETVVVSVAAGVTLATIEASLAAGVPVVRVMPNTPMLVGKGMSAVVGGRFARAEQVEAVRAMMEAVGAAVVVGEKDMDAVTAVSGSGPAYIFLVAEAMVEAGVQLGLARPVAEQLAGATIEGAAAMLVAGEKSAFELRGNVTSPGGTTAAAVRGLEENGIRKAFYQAMEACARRSAELGRPRSDED
ncbi:pyrroline-5-carboxylate reductase [Corynebacterium terpenotabidum]|uniref:Pyrroline-5-carboxylate reductase n=1 Tax=Corynebacterium terpenotabidum Y-11 TaxID=1200352 RepID=S4XIT8_9CORY|nr:pyrroline-5-carboxylate reductase [Corynebacterium terpenotabidum]AGP31670.1 pyrroline-5-carboxylate reductase [Corynebacterium terpenotabidum Y-11]